MRCFWKIFHLIKQWQRQENHRLLATWLYTRSRKALSCRAWNRAKRKPCRLCAVLLSLSGLSCCAGAYFLISSSVSLPIPCSFLFVHISIHSSLSYLINALCSLYLSNRWRSVSISVPDVLRASVSPPLSSARACLASFGKRDLISGGPVTITAAPTHTLLP